MTLAKISYDWRDCYNRIRRLDRLYSKACAIQDEFIRTGDMSLWPKVRRAFANYRRRVNMNDLPPKESVPC